MYVGFENRRGLLECSYIKWQQDGYLGCFISFLLFLEELYVEVNNENTGCENFSSHKWRLNVILCR